MIIITKKEKCCGCESCVQLCPQKCISFNKDNEGFLYPIVCKEKCNNCGLCERVCPVLSQNNSREPLYVYAAKNRDEIIREQSSSGGVFTLLAKQTILQGGVVFGAKFDSNWEVIHHFAETVDGVADFRGSKYVQSRIGNSFVQVRSFLKANRRVLFSGTPCQVAGLNHFLGKEYENLITVDFICHGVPSPLVWQRYKKELLQERGGESFVALNFRDKTDGWKKYRFEATVRNEKMNSHSFHTPFFQNPYMGGFLQDLYLRPSCHHCPSKSLKSGSDITMADFWGIQNILPDFDDDKGVSLVFINSHKGESLWNSECESMEAESCNIIRATASNSAFYKSAKPHRNRNRFFEEIDKKTLGNLIKKNTRITANQRARQLVKRLLISLKLYK